jgi:hypothetical protein
MTTRLAATAGASIARIRDIPRLCICEWELNRAAMAWIRTRPAAGCPWHGAL